MEEGGLKHEWVGEVTYLILKEEYYFTLCVMAGGGTRPHLEFGLPVANDKVTFIREKEKLSPWVGNKRLKGKGTPKYKLLPF